MLVSHDRALLRSVCDEFWLVGRGKVTDFDGDLDDYQRYLLEEAKRQRELAKEAGRATAASSPEASEPQAPVAAPVAAPAPAVSSREQRQQEAQERQQRQERQKPIKRELAKAEARMAAAGAEREQIEARLTQPLPPAEIAEAGKRLKALTEEIEGLEELWLRLTDELEAAGA
jgi:ATP-binding cassette subfamily F protein 3